MTRVVHRFLQHKIDPHTESLIIGTFNPETEKNTAVFFYGRSRNFLWTLLPKAFGEASLKEKTKEEKYAFIKKFNIDFSDLISEVDVDQEANYEDIYLDNKVTIWTDVLSQLRNLPHLKRVCVTRRSFGGIPNMKKKILEIQQFCETNHIKFQLLTTPARFYSVAKQLEWNDFFK